jgi:hypothetical protein
MNYSWLTPSPRSPVLQLPAYRARYDDQIQGGGWFAFLPKDVDQDDESKAGTWLGPTYYQTTAIPLAYEQNELSRQMLGRWKSEMMAQLKAKAALTPSTPASRPHNR